MVWMFEISGFCFFFNAVSKLEKKEGRRRLRFYILEEALICSLQGDTARNGMANILLTESSCRVME